MFTKISICLFLLRITVSKSFIRPLQASIVILIVSNVVISLMWILQCRPHLDKAWNTKQPGTCFVKAELEHIILAQAGKLAPRLLLRSLTHYSRLLRIRLLSLGVPHFDPAKSPNQLPK